LTPEQDHNRRTFFDHFRSLAPTTESERAVQEIERFAATTPEVQLEFTVNRVEHSILIRVSSVSPTNALMKVESGGALELLNDQHASLRVKKGLSWLGYELGSKETSLDRKKPRFPRGHWEADLPKLLRLLKAFTLELEEVVEYADPRRWRARQVAPQPKPMATPPATAPQEVEPQTIEFHQVSPQDSTPPAGGKPGSDAGAIAEPPIDWTDERIRVACSRWLRSHQSEFRSRLLEEYGNRCAISGFGPVEILEAAHIVGHAESGNSSLTNGLLLRADLHGLFDLNLLRIDPESRTVVVDARAKDYMQLQGVRLRDPASPASRPSTERLRARWTGAGLDSAPATATLSNDVKIDPTTGTRG